MQFEWQSIRRIWQPHRGLFWVMLALNVLSSALVWYVQLADPPGAIRWLLSLLALGNAGLGWWLAVRLWREGAEPPTP
ncbi:MAG: hypothetical protein ACK40L_08310 [Hydrogenophaga sp.]|jgi:hypothetical protein|nr:hypothetical protein [Hydrogenophaga sp.]